MFKLCCMYVVVCYTYVVVCYTYVVVCYTLITFVIILAYTWQQSHDRNRTLVRYYVLQSRTNVWYLTKVIHSYEQRHPKLSTSYPHFKIRMLSTVNRFNVRQTIINVALKRFADDIRTIRRQTVVNVRKSYPQAKKSYPQVIHRSIKLSTTYPQVIHRRRRTCVRRGGGGGRTRVRVAEYLKDSYKFLKLGSLFNIV